MGIIFFLILWNRSNLHITPNIFAFCKLFLKIDMKNQS